MIIINMLNGLIDLVAGLLLAFLLFGFKIDFFLTLGIGIAIAAKSAYNFVKSSKIHGFIDLVSAAFLLLASFSVFIPFAEAVILILSILILIKGLFVILTNLVS